jgi:subtilase family serine protease
MLRKRFGRRTAARMSRFAQLASKVRMEELEQRIMLSAVSALPRPILPTAPAPLQGVVSIPTSMGPQLFDTSFGFNNFYYQSGGNFVKADGAGQTIAIVDPYGSPTIVSDVEKFDSYWGISNNDSTGQFFLTVQALTASNYTIQYPASVVSAWSGETSLDVEWAHAVAPAAHILLVDPASQTPGDVMLGNVYAAEQPGVVVVSNSDDYPYNPQEATNPTDFFFFAGEPDNYDGFFVTPNGHLDSDGLPGGVVFMASSGDVFGQFGFPAGSDNVVAVGGMTIDTDLNGNVTDIGTWDNEPLVGGAVAPQTPITSVSTTSLLSPWMPIL